MNGTINILNLGIGYNHKAMVSSIFANLNPGELVCIVGRNGGGKSTFIKTLCKLIPPIQGKIELDNLDLIGISNQTFSKYISVVLTSKITVQQLTVKDFIAFGRYPFTNFIGKLSNLDIEHIQNAIDLCNLSEIVQRDFSTLSDGEKQKVNIARAIAQNTPVIILDEPTAHLDLVNNIEIFKLLKNLTKNHQKLIILSTHHIELALKLGDKICVINKGECFIDSPQSIISSKKIEDVFEKNNIKYNALNNNFEFEL